MSEFNLEEQKVVQRVYALLASRGYFEEELRTKLLADAFSKQAVDKILAECSLKGYIDDVRQGEMFVQREIRKGRGREKMEAILKRKGISDCRSILNLLSETEEKKAIASWLIKKQWDRSNDQKERGKMYRFLRNKGFSHHLIYQELFTP